MVVYVEAAGSGGGLVPAVGAQALEDVAEGVLNGILCTYEPPDPRRLGLQRGILRGQKTQKQRHRRQANRHIRWKDEPIQTPKIMKWNETIQRVCVDASMELGCTTMDTEQAIAKARSKAAASPKHNNDLIFDDEGFPKYRSETASKNPPPPPLPVVPPPSKKEPFLPQLCGVGLGWGEDDETRTLSTSDAPSSIVDEFRFEPPPQQQLQIRRQNATRYPQMDEATVVPIVEEKVSNSSDEENADWGSGSITSSSSLFYRVFSKKNRTEKKHLKAMPIVEEKTSTDSEIEEKPFAKPLETKFDDWDESVPVVSLDTRSVCKPETLQRQRPSGLRSSKSPSILPTLPRPKSPIVKSSSEPFKRKTKEQSSFYHKHATTEQDQSDRESYIGAFRRGSEYGLPQELRSREYRRTRETSHDSEWDRQSYITASRQEYAARSQPAKTVTAPASNQTHPPVVTDTKTIPSLESHRAQRRRSRSPTSRHQQSRSPSKSQEKLVYPQLPYERLPMPGYYGFYQPPDGSMPRYFDPTNPQAFAVVPQHMRGEFLQPQPKRLPEVHPRTETVVPQQSSSSLSSELTWEDRTRKALDQLRGGVAALSLDSSDNNKLKMVGESPPTMPSYSKYQANDWESCPPTLMQSPSFPREQLEHPSRRVTFGEPQKLVYYDTIDENQSERSFSSRGSTLGRKKKLRFRGTKVIEGALGRMKRSLVKVGRSIDRQPTFENNKRRSHAMGNDPIERDRFAAHDFSPTNSLPPSEASDEFRHLYRSDYENSPMQVDRGNSHLLSDKN